MKRTLMMIAILMTAAPPADAAFDHAHGAWNDLLRRHVVWIRDGAASEADYAGFQKDREALEAYLQTLSAVTRTEFDAWTKDQQLAFLINAYNAFTVALILTKYPDLKSIKDLGSFFSSPWKKEFFVLLGEKRHLDWVEHDMIRKPGVYDDPRIHAAVNCASIGCPALRDEAFTAENLDAQLEDNMRRFLSDRTRNRYIPETGKLAVSKIFDWYGGDFNKGYRGIASLKSFFARYADLLADTPEDREAIRAGKAKIDFMDYDWGLNDKR